MENFFCFSQTFCHVFVHCVVLYYSSYFQFSSSVGSCWGGESLRIFKSHFVRVFNGIWNHNTKNRWVSNLKFNYNETILWRIKEIQCEFQSRGTNEKKRHMTTISEIFQFCLEFSISLRLFPCVVKNHENPPAESLSENKNIKNYSYEA